MSKYRVALRIARVPPSLDDPLGQIPFLAQVIVGETPPDENTCSLGAVTERKYFRIDVEGSAEAVEENKVLRLLDDIVFTPIKGVIAR